jgi:molybdopterin-binding protein
MNESPSPSSSRAEIDIAAHVSGARIAAMKISARNQLRGTVEEIVRGVITAKVSVRVGENLIESVITLQSVDEMGIKNGDTVTALIKSTEVLLMAD